MADTLAFLQPAEEPAQAPLRPVGAISERVREAENDFNAPGKAWVRRMRSRVSRPRSAHRVATPSGRNCWPMAKSSVPVAGVRWSADDARALLERQERSRLTRWRFATETRPHDTNLFNPRVADYCSLTGVPPVPAHASSMSSNVVALSTRSAHWDSCSGVARSSRASVAPSGAPNRRVMSFTTSSCRVRRFSRCENPSQR
jgi:hypothetical protein